MRIILLNPSKFLSILIPLVNTYVKGQAIFLATKGQAQKTYMEHPAAAFHNHCFRGTPREMQRVFLTTSRKTAK
jgi:hypothetical protein